MSIFRFLNPFAVVREYIKRPIEVFVLNQYLGYKKKTDDSITSVKELVYRVAIITLFITAILWISIFMYVGFYNIYMPNVTHVRPVHFQFKPCEDKAGICSYPYAYVQLTRQSHILMPKQPYRIKLMLEMPESQVNKDLGMFMVCVQMRAKGGFLVSSSCRSAMIRYRSILHHIMRTFVLSPLYLGGVDEEKQQLKVELFSDFEDDPANPATDAYVELQSRFAQVYSSELQVQAHFTGLRYLMFNWPKISAVFGICTNLFFVSLIFILSWYHLQDGLPDFIKNKFRPDLKTEEEDTKFMGKVKLEREDSALFDEDALLKEFQQIETKETKKT
ncbi:lipid droplet biogenesis associated protein seipin [Anticarsia gemmatalis]|uniref:lipid droplet biogenesis associated protein seipin n=1 Tax=Anticarsia gemmatalis TaxID=129554 RepID=UPI003F76191A